MYADAETGLYYWNSRYYDPRIGRGIQADRMSVAEHVARWMASLGTPNQLPLELNPYAYTANNPLRWIDPLGFFTEVTVWDPVGMGSSSFGHVSSNINGRNFSFGPGGWDKTYPNAADYIARQREFRGGTGYQLGLTPDQEIRLTACLNRSNKPYGEVSNNCGSPIQECLNEVGVPMRRSVLPGNLGKELSGSPFRTGTTYYSGPPGPSYPPLPMVP